MRDPIAPRLAAGRTGSSLNPSIIVVALILIFGLAWMAFRRLPPRQLAGAASAQATAAVSKSEAVAVARSAVPSDATETSEELGLFGTVTLPPGSALDGASADQLVWLIRFERSFEICRPDGVCLSPRPGYSYVVVNPETGSWITTYGYSPP